MLIVRYSRGFGSPPLVIATGNTYKPVLTVTARRCAAGQRLRSQKPGTELLYQHFT